MPTPDELKNKQETQKPAESPEAKAQAAGAAAQQKREREAAGALVALEGEESPTETPGEELKRLQKELQERRVEEQRKREEKRESDEQFKNFAESLTAVAKSETLSRIGKAMHAIGNERMLSKIVDTVETLQEEARQSDKSNEEVKQQQERVLDEALTNIFLGIAELDEASKRSAIHDLIARGGGLDDVIKNQEGRLTGIRDSLLSKGETIPLALR